MTPQLISLNPKLTPRTTLEKPKPASSTPKLLDRTAFPTKTPKGTRPAKREPGHGELRKNTRTVRPTPRSSQPKRTSRPAPSEASQTSQPRTPQNIGRAGEAIQESGVGSEELS